MKWWAIAMTFRARDVEKARRGDNQLPGPGEGPGPDVEGYQRCMGPDCFAVIMVSGEDGSYRMLTEDEGPRLCGGCQTRAQRAEEAAGV